MDRAPSVVVYASAHLIAARDSGPGTPAAPAGDRLRLLPSGPDLVHKPTPRGTRPIDAPCGGASGAKPLEREFSPARADCGFRAPLHPRLARSTNDPTPRARQCVRLPAVMNFNHTHSPNRSRARFAAAAPALCAVALIAGCGSSGGSSSITVGNESDVASVPHVKG